MAATQAIVSRALAATAVALIAFCLYRATLLPGFDLGDTASFQAEASLTPLSPRHGYPLYLTTGRLAVAALGGDPARALNLTSAVAGAAACGVTALVAGALAGSVSAGLVAGLLLASSYTFWSQSIIAEVYALHVLLVALCCAGLVWWRSRPSLARLGLFMGVYSLSFGHHLSMILLAPAFAIFLLVAARRDLGAVVGVRPAVLALLLAAFGALQYLTGLQSLWFAPDPPATLAEGLRTFWFDVTKADWRESMVLAVHPSAMTDRIAMWFFDLVQQFGLPGALLAVAGVAGVRAAAERALLVAGYLVPAAFAFGYNVGDVHVFFLTSHFMTALLAGCGVGALQQSVDDLQPNRPALRALLIMLVLAYPAWRIWDTYPALDRSADRRPEQLFDSFTAGLSSDNSMLGADLNWQLQNGLTYYARHHKPDLPVLRMAEHMLQAPFLISDNRAAGREVVVSEDARARLAAAYGPRYAIVRDSRVSPRSLSAVISSAPRGTIYVLNVLTPTRDYLPLSPALGSLVRVLTGGAVADVHAAPYVAVAGRSGERPILIRQSDRPFRDRVRMAGVEIDVRMESWLSTDTIRRAGFGHVIVNRRHALIVERGVSLVTLDEQGRAGLPVYAHNIFEDLPRYIVRRQVPRSPDQPAARVDPALP
jgi:hypothetical protein